MRLASQTGFYRKTNSANGGGVVVGFHRVSDSGSQPTSRGIAPAPRSLSTKLGSSSPFSVPPFVSFHPHSLGMK